MWRSLSRPPAVVVTTWLGATTTARRRGEGGTSYSQTRPPGQCSLWPTQAHLLRPVAPQWPVGLKGSYPNQTKTQSTSPVTSTGAAAAPQSWYLQLQNGGLPNNRYRGHPGFSQWAGGAEICIYSGQKGAKKSTYVSSVPCCRLHRRSHIPKSFRRHMQIT